MTADGLAAGHVVCNTMYMSRMQVGNRQHLLLFVRLSRGVKGDEEEAEGKFLFETFKLKVSGL